MSIFQEIKMGTFPFSAAKPRNSGTAPSLLSTPSLSIFHTTVLGFSMLAEPFVGGEIATILKQEKTLSVITAWVAPGFTIFFASSSKIFSSSSSSGVIGGAARRKGIHRLFELFNRGDELCVLLCLSGKAHNTDSASRTDLSVLCAVGRLFGSEL